MNPTPDATHNLDDLVRATGFSKRQIRFYITKKLIPAAETRGPNAVYPEETLRRLLRIAELKLERVGPARRKLSLEEIRHELDNHQPGDHGEDGLGGLGSTIQQFMDKEPQARFQRSARTESSIDEVRDSGPFEQLAMICDSGASEPTPGPLEQLLGRLGDALLDLSETGPGLPDAWLRVTHPETESILEIHVRQPDDARGRAQWAALEKDVDRIRRHLAATEDDQ